MIRRLPALLPLAVVAAAAAAAPTVAVFHAVDTRLCGFPLDVTIRTTDRPGQVGTSALKFDFTGPATITLKNASTGRTATLRSDGRYDVDTTTGNIGFRGHELWFWSSGNRIPFLATSGRGALRVPEYFLEPGSSRAQVVDPCALVSRSRAVTAPRTTRAPWPVPAHTLSHIAYAGLIPVIGALVRHDHAHLDIVVNGRKVAVPAAIGLAEPANTGHAIFAQVANSPIHTHDGTGMLHVESDRLLPFTLGQFFDEWGVRLTADCIGGYCAGGGRRLAVFVDGRRRTGDPRRIKLRDRQDIAVVFGAGKALRAPPRYRGLWPGP